MSPEVAELIRYTLWRTIAINSTFRLALWADMLYAADGRWWNHPQNKDVSKFLGMKVSMYTGHDDPDLDVALIQRSETQGFDDRPGFVCTGNNSGYQAIHIAAHAGCSRIVLCGFDMRSVKNRNHWHDNHPHPLRDHGEGIYRGWIENFKTLAPILAKKGIKVLNATPKSALTCFESVDLKKLIDESRPVSPPAPVIV